MGGFVSNMWSWENPPEGEVQGEGGGQDQDSTVMYVATADPGQSQADCSQVREMGWKRSRGA